MRWVAVHYGHDGGRAVFRNITGDSREEVWRKQIARSRVIGEFKWELDSIATATGRDHAIIGYLAMRGWGVEPDSPSSAGMVRVFIENTTGKGEGVMWTKTPPTKPGWYRLYTRNRSVGDMFQVADLVIDERGARWWYETGCDYELSESDILWYWPEPIEFPPLPSNTNTPDQAGA